MCCDTFYIGVVRCKHCGQEYDVNVAADIRYYICGECGRRFIGTYKSYWPTYLRDKAFDMRQQATITLDTSDDEKTGQMSLW